MLCMRYVIVWLCTLALGHCVPVVLYRAVVLYVAAMGSRIVVWPALVLARRCWGHTMSVSFHLHF